MKPAEQKENTPYRIFISAAEPSADAHCANLIRAVRAANPSIEFVGLGGEKMAAAGCKLIENTASRAAMHYKVLSQIDYYFHIIKCVKSYYKHNKIDLTIVCDSPSFNIHIAKISKKFVVKNLFYVAPQLWAWGSGRIKKLRKYCDRLACILPFEQQWFSERGVAAQFVGNPLFDNLPPSPPRVFDTEKPHIALMPGSRQAEIDSLWLPMQQIAAKLLQVFPKAKVTAVAANEKILQSLKASQLKELVCQYSISSVFETACTADITLVASGSATLQVAAAGSPMIVMYQSNKYLWQLLGRRLIKLKYLSLVNILAQKPLVPEFMPYFDSIAPIFMTCERILLDKNGLSRVSNELIAITEPLKSSNASGTVAAIVLEML